MDITSTRLHQGLHTCNSYAGEYLNLSQITINREVKVKTELVTTHLWSLEV